MNTALSLEPWDNTSVVEDSHDRRAALHRCDIEKTASRGAKIFKMLSKGEGSNPSRPESPSNLFSEYIKIMSTSWTCSVEQHRLISTFRDLRVTHADNLVARLEYLWAASIEDQPTNCVISSASLRHFRNFVESHPMVSYPDVTITPGGEVYAQWRGQGKNLFALQFLTPPDVRFLVFVPNADHPEKITRVSGTDTGDSVFEKLDKAYGISKWVVH